MDWTDKQKQILTYLIANGTKINYLLNSSSQYDDYGGGYDTQRAGGTASGFESYAVRCGDCQGEQEDQVQLMLLPISEDD